MQRLLAHFLTIVPAVLFIALMLIIGLPDIALAQGTPPAGGSAPVTQLQDYLQLGDEKPIAVLAGRIIKAFLGIVGIIALVMFLYGGFLWLTSSGNSQKIEEGRNIFVWAILGLVVIFSSYVLVSFVFEKLLQVSP